MKIRIGIGTSGAQMLPAELELLCEAVMDTNFDSSWVSEVLSQPGLDPLISLAWLSGRLPRLKIGTTFLLPGRNPLRLARQLATLDHLSGGRLLLVGVPGLSIGQEGEAVGVAVRERGRAIDEILPVLTSLLAGNPTDVTTPAGVVEGVLLDPLPVQQPLDIWLGGIAPRSLERCGELSGGWLPAMLTPEEAAAGRRTIEASAERHDRQIDPEHFGVSVAYSMTPLDETTVQRMTARSRGHRVEDLVPTDRRALRRLLEAYLEAGMSKFVLRPLVTPENWVEELGLLAEAVGDLQN